MAILEGATFSKTFADGFAKGTEPEWATMPPSQRCPLTQLPTE
jgi:hypothetical protein